MSGDRLPPLLGGGLPVHTEQLLGHVHVRQEGDVGIAVASGPLGGLRAGRAGHPHRRVRLLDGHHPRVDRPVVVVLALPAEGAGRSPRLDQQVVALLEPLPVLHRVHVGGHRLHARPAHHAGYDAPAGDNVNHRNLFRQPHRVLVDGQDVAQQQNPGVLRGAGQHCCRQVARSVHARRRAVVLVDHDAVVAQLVHILALVKVPLEQPVGRWGIEVAVGESEPYRRVLEALLVGILVVGKLAEVVDLHGGD